MLRKLSIFTTAVTVLALTAGLALAEVNFKSGPTVTFSADNTSATATGEMTGLGNTPAIGTLDVDGSVTYTCRNKGGNAAPGQNPVPASGTASQDLGNSDHNGRGTLNVTASLDAPAPTVSGNVAGCPNGNWRGTDPVSSGITSATLTITQGGETIFGPETFDNPNN